MVYISKTLESLRVKKMTRANIQVKLSEGILKTHIENINLDDKGLSEVLKAYKAGKKYVLLKDEVILTDTEEVKALYDFVNHHNLNINKLTEEHKHPMYHLFKFEDPSEYISIEVEEKLKKIMNHIMNYQNKKIKNPPHTYSILKPYQKEGLNWLMTLYEENLGGILADDMGLGKTLQVISLLETIKTDKPILVVCPKSLVFNWSFELIKFKATFNQIIYSGIKDIRDELFLKIKNVKEKTIIITSYDTLRNDIEAIKEIKFDTVILDEAQHIKTIHAQKTQAVKEINSKHKFVLTGTPIENAISDLWSIFDFLMPGYLYQYAKFKKLELKATDSDKEALEFIVSKTKPFILRRTKKQVLKDLPDKTEELIYMNFGEKEEKIYQAHLLKVKEKLESKDINKMDLLADITKLRQLCLSPSFIYPDYSESSTKIDETLELIKTAILGGHKVLVFSSFVKALDTLKEKLDTHTYFMLTGKTDAKERLQMTNKFNQEDSLEKVFLISLKAGGTGLNLTGADIVIHLDPWWNIAAENQATDRAHRIGQNKKIIVYKMIMKDSIEEKVIELQEKKKELFEAVIESNDELSKKVSIEDYKYLLS